MLAEQLWKEHFAEVHARRRPVERPIVLDAESSRIPAGEECGPRRRAARGDIGVRADGPLAGQPVDARSGNVGAARETAITYAEVVDEDHNDVGRPTNSRRAGDARGQQPGDGSQDEWHDQ